MATTVPFKTQLGQDELRSRAHKLGQRHRTLLFLIDGRRPLAEVLSLAQQAGAATRHFEDLLRLGLVELPPDPTTSVDAPSAERAVEAALTSVELVVPADADAAETLPAPLVTEVVAPVLHEVVLPVVDEVVAPRVDEVVAPVARDIASPQVGELAAPRAGEVVPPRGPGIEVPVISDVVAPAPDLPVAREAVAPAVHVPVVREVVVPAFELAAADQTVSAEDPRYAGMRTTGQSFPEAEIAGARVASMPAAPAAADEEGPDAERVLEPVPREQYAAPLPADRRPHVPAAHPHSAREQPLRTRTTPGRVPPAAAAEEPAALAPPPASIDIDLPLPDQQEARMLQQVRELLIDTLRIDAPLFSARIFVRVRNAQSVSELIDLVWEIQDHLSHKRRSRRELQSLQRARELLGLGNTLVSEDSRTDYDD